jgi:hypothetical protein
LTSAAGRSVFHPWAPGVLDDLHQAVRPEFGANRHVALPREGLDAPAAGVRHVETDDFGMTRVRPDCVGAELENLGADQP